MSEQTLYQQLKQAGVETDNHRSDLYFPSTKESREILERNPNCRAKGFTSQIDGQWWFEVPFAFDPFWERKPAEASD